MIGTFLFTRRDSGTIEFDEFLDIMWDIKHAKGSARGLLFRRAGVLLGGTFAAAQSALQTKRQERSTASHGLLLRGSDTDAERKSGRQRDGSQSTTTANSTATSAALEQQQEEHAGSKQLVKQRHFLATTATTTVAAAVIRGKEAALSFLPKLTGKTVTWNRQS